MAFIHVARIVALLSSCISFGFVIWSRRWHGEVGVLCLFCWSFSFLGSFLVLLMEIFSLIICVRPEFCRNVAVLISSYAAMFCLNVSIIFPFYFLKGQEDKEFYNHCIVAELFSCVAVLAHFVEVWIMWIKADCYMATGPGLLQVSQMYVASCIFFFLINTVSFRDDPLVIGSLVGYFLCFIWTSVNIMLNALHNKNRGKWLKGLDLIAAIMQLGASSPLFQLRQDLSQIVCSESCRDDLGLWPETKLMVVVALTALNCLLYLLSICCCCMLGSNDDQTEENSTSSINSDSCLRQITETQAVLPVSRALQQYNTTRSNQSLNKKALRIQNSTLYIQNSTIQVIIVT
ncbi:myeloid-associated differentiation marker homolog [Clarias gariepinus]|uniref:myeloid-associated differentiation marker homolog n=1 Tax=Clarias gariepinus TaxID=13013 RepID=UPI00234D8FDC|nr:myeloid-associated differentiation marker homolog [Clarias gariepinus]